MTLETADVVALAVLVVAGPWGLVLVVALIRGYNLRVSMKRRARERRRRPPGDREPGQEP